MGQRPGNSRNQVLLDPQTSLRERFKVLAVCCFLVLMVLLVFGQASCFEMIVCDDDPYVFGNPHVIEGFHTCAWKSWSDNPLWWSLTTCTAGNWHPLTWMSHIIDGQLWGIHGIRFFGGKPVFSGEGEAWKGPEAGWHHLTSVLLHAAAAVFLFLAMRRLTAAFWCSALGGGDICDPSAAGGIGGVGGGTQGRLERPVLDADAVGLRQLRRCVRASAVIWASWACSPWACRPSRCW